MYKIIRPILFLFPDPEIPHYLALKVLKFIGFIKPLQKILKYFTSVNDPRLAQTIFDVEFKNPIGVAAGMDKNGEAILGLESLGFGAIEIGTISRFPQPGNPRPRLFRLIKDKAIINRMGFNSIGSVAVAKKLQSLKKDIPIGISIGKSKVTPLEEAPMDYVSSFNTLFPFADYFAINISSPNTHGLRELQEKDALLNLVKKLTEANKHKAEELKTKRKPILIKIAPDLTFSAIKEIIDVALENNIDGLIATNTTLDRQNLKTAINETGGLSGLPLKDRATEIIRFIHKEAPNLPIIGVGGIFTAEDAYEKLKAGASLLQVYTSFIYIGPIIAKNLNVGILKLMDKDKIGNIKNIQRL